MSSLLLVGISYRNGTNMPAMLRIKGKTTKIAYDILGKPQNMEKDRKTKKDRLIDRRLEFEDTYRVR